jgi:hypothetical protein
VEEVDGGALDHPVDPGGEVVPSDDARVKGARNARAYIPAETLRVCKNVRKKDDIPKKEKNGVCLVFTLVMRWIRTSPKKEDPQFCGSPF